MHNNSIDFERDCCVIVTIINIIDIFCIHSAILYFENDEM